METQVYTNSAVSVDFVYDDTDSFQNEIAELYSYSENGDFKINFMDFKADAESLDLSAIAWQSWSAEEQINFATREIDHLEFCNDEVRVRAARGVLYLVQGCWAEVRTVEEQQSLSRENVKLFFRAGILQSMISLLNMELEKVCNAEKAADEADENYVCPIDPALLRVIFNVLYTVVETIRQEKLNGSPDFGAIAEECINEMSNYFDDGGLSTIKLLNMVTKFCSGTGANFPIKKILLLVWKSSLLILGGTNALKARKNELRSKAGLEAALNDTLNVSKLMPPSVMSSEDSSVSKRGMNAAKRRKILWDAVCENMDETKKRVDAVNKFKKIRGNRDDEDMDVFEDVLVCEQNSRTQQPLKNFLPFESKVRLNDIDNFLQKARQKYFGFSIDNDTETTFGLPLPIQESVRALKRHLYVSLSEKQITDEVRKENLLYIEENIETTPAELLYQALLPNFRNYMTDLLRIMLAASPSAKLTTNNLNSRVVASVLPNASSAAAVFSSFVQTDITRHKEIIVKAITATLLLYLKHFRLNHVYQYEYMSQLLAQSSFIKLSLQVFAPLIPEYVTHQTSSVPTREFPLRLIKQSLEDSSNDLSHAISGVPDSSYKWRNLFACINLMRILNKLVKWKNSRILNMVSMKSSNSLINILQIRQPLLQIYVLKLLKMQSRHLGRYWRRTNLKVMTAIYTKVRHRFNDDWAYGYDAATKYWNAQDEENELRKCIMRFNNRRYPHIAADIESVNKISNSNDAAGSKSITSNTCEQFSNGNSEVSSEGDCTREQSLNSLMASNVSADLETYDEEDLPDDFKENYEVWLNEQVFSKNIDWDSI